MKRVLFLVFVVGVGLLLSCQSAKKQEAKTDNELDSLLAIGRMTPELMWKFGRVNDLQLSPDGKKILYGITRYELKENKGMNNLFVMDLASGNVQQISDGKSGVSNGVWMPDGNRIAYLGSESGSTQIWEVKADGTERRKISNVEAELVGFSFSPDGKKVMMVQEVKLDSNAQDLHPDMPKSNVRIINSLNYRHWDSWSNYTYQHIFIADYAGGMIDGAKDIMENEKFDSPVKPNGGMEQIAWSPDSKSIAYTSKKTSGTEYAKNTNSDIFLYNLENGSTTNITEGMPGYDMDPVFSPDGKKLVIKSMKRAVYEADKERIMVYDLSAKTWKDYSETFDQSSGNFCFSEDGNTLYFISGIHATYQIYALNLNDGQIRQITRGDHDYTSLNVQGETMVGQRMAINMPAEIFRIDIKTGEETQVTFTNKNILDKIEMGKVEARWIPTTDGKQMLTWVIYPPKFDSTKKYPALLYCQGGPQSAVSQFFSYRWNFQMMAANDYIIVAPNRRGLPSFGQEWNDQIMQDYGGQNIQDYLSAIDAVSAEPYVNKDKLGAVGASYGGFSVYYLASHHEKRFKAFISHCGMFNFESWYGSTEEYWFPASDLGGAYWDQPTPKGYAYSPHKFVDKWDTPIMIITGGRDFRIPYTESLQAFNAAQLRGIPSKLLFFPEETHFVTKPQNAVIWQREFFGWLDTYLK